MTIRSEMLRSKLRDVRPDLEKAREVAEKATDENRAMTAAEKAVYDAAMGKARPLLEALEAERSDQAVEAAARELHLGPGKSGQRLSFKGIAAGVAERMVRADLGAKALAPSGATVVPQAFTPDPVALGRPAQGLLDVLPVVVRSSAEYAFIRQTTRTNNAAVVPEGDEKPTTVLGLERVEQTLAVIAHLSEGVPRYWLTDNGALEAFIAAELEHGLRVAVESMVIDDVNTTSGIQTQDYSTSVVQTIRKALTKIEVAGHVPGAIVVHPSDFETVELGVATANAIEYSGLPFDAAARRLFGTPIAVTVSQAAGTAHVIAADAVLLDTDASGVGVQWSETSNADDFARNLIRARVEGRYGTSVLAPLGVVVADIGGGS